MSRNMNVINGFCVYPEGIFKKNIEVRDGVITNVCDDAGSLSPCENIIDANCFVFPGMIDSHVHIRGGSFSYREDFYSGSKAAVSSGITTILEMPGCAKPASTLENFMLRVPEVKENGAISFGLYGGAGYDNIDEIPKLAKAGAIGFKTFQMAPVKGRESEFYGLCSETYEDLVSVMECIKKTGLTLTVHCESQSIIDKLSKEIQDKGINSLIGFCDSRPVEAETESVKLTIAACEKTGCPTIIAHVSAPKTINIIEDAKKRGVPIFAESCLHYLTFDKFQMEKFGVFGRMKPPFRTRKEADEMALMYGEGKIDITGSDHAPYTWEEKTKNGINNVWQTVDGLYGLEMSLPLLLRLKELGKIRYENIAASFSENTAKIFKLSKKGRIEKGNDADFVFVKALDKEEKIDITKLNCKCKECALIYDGIPVKHRIIRTVSNGKVVFENGKVLLNKGEAKLLGIPVRGN